MLNSQVFRGELTAEDRLFLRWDLLTGDGCPIHYVSTGGHILRPLPMRCQADPVRGYASELLLVFALATLRHHLYVLDKVLSFSHILVHILDLVRN